MKRKSAEFYCPFAGIFWSLIFQVPMIIPGWAEKLPRFLSTCRLRIPAGIFYFPAFCYPAVDSPFSSFPLLAGKNIFFRKIKGITPIDS